jgi:D-alanyl-lipoteichoic acid acyltransferase DltB (MBOAT superfamily)
MALGAADTLGIRLMQNFKRPYLARNISEFWGRWHISLSTWFRDYVYIPLGGNRVAKVRWYSNLMIVFLVSGFWHGANWTFIVWGGLHGVYLVSAILTQSLRERVTRLLRLDHAPVLHLWLQRFVVFQLASLAWVFFRARSIAEAWHIILSMLLPWRWGTLRDLPRDSHNWIAIFVGLVVLAIVHNFQERGRVRDIVARQPGWLRWTAYACAVATVWRLGRFTNQDFIYFQF